MNKRQSLTLLWIVLVVGGLSGISLYRQQYFEEHVESTISELKEEMEKHFFELEEKWKTLDKSDPEEISHYFELEALYHRYPYIIDFCHYLQNQEKGNLLTGTFTTQAYEGALLEGSLIIRSAVSMPTL